MSGKHHSSKPGRANRQIRLHWVEMLESRTLLSAGDLDSSFGAGGRVWSDFPTLSQETARQAAKQSDGKIIVLVTETGSSAGSSLARYSASGVLDSAFGSGGTVALPFKVGSIAVRGDDKIFVAGYSADNSDPNGLILARYTPAGQVDSIFGGGDGHIEQPLFGDAGNQFKNIARLLIRSDNTMIVAGDTSRDAQQDIALQALSAAGTADPSFGDSGLVFINNGLYDHLGDATLTPSSGIVAAGSSGDFDAHHPFARMDFEIAKYTSNGLPDPTFGHGTGVVITSFGSFPQTHPFSEPPFDSFDEAQAVAIDSSGMIVAAGRSFDPTDNDPDFFAMARYLPNGDLDTTFAPGGVEGNGKLWTSFGSANRSHDIALLPAGKILVSTTVTGFDGSDFGLARFNADGSFDATFGISGQVYTNMGGENVAGDLLLQPDDRAIIVGGALDTPISAPTPPDGPVALVRYFAGVRQPFGSAPISLPGVIQLEDYDRGGENISIHDTEAANLGGVYRTGPQDAADVQAIPASGGGGYTLAFARAGEWTQYTLNISQAGSYNLAIRLASLKGGGRFSLQLDGGTLVPATTVPNTGDWQKYTSLALGSVNLAAGTHILRLNMDANDPTGYVANFDSLSVQISRAPFHNTPFHPGDIIQAEDFDTGGEGITFHDTDAANLGSASYRPGAGVDIEPASDTGGGFNVGYAKAGEWLEYTLSNPGSSDLTVGIDVRLASLRAGGKFHFEIDGISVASFTAPATGSWQTYVTLHSAKNIHLTPGQHVLRLKMEQNNSTGYVANFNYLQLV